MVTRHTVRTGREFALNLPMALFFILLPLLLLFARIFPLLASCCLIQSCSDTAPLLGHRSLTHRLPTEQIHLLDSSKPKSSAMEVPSSSCLAGLTQHPCFYETQTTTSTTPVRLCRHGMFGPAPPRILDLHTRGCLRPAAPEQVPNAAAVQGEELRHIPGTRAVGCSLALPLLHSWPAPPAVLSTPGNFGFAVGTGQKQIQTETCWILQIPSR